MSHEELIVTLASEARPVRPLPAPTVRLARWVLATLVAVCIGVALRGLRANWATAFGAPSFVITNLLILVVALLAGWAALSLSVPGAPGADHHSACASRGAARLALDRRTGRTVGRGIWRGWHRTDLPHLSRSSPVRLSLPACGRADGGRVCRWKLVGEETVAVRTSGPISGPFVQQS